MTGGGVSSGLDDALKLLEYLTSSEIAQQSMIRLGRDANDYLDFAIPAAPAGALSTTAIPKPETVRLMEARQVELHPAAARSFPSRGGSTC